MDNALIISNSQKSISFLTEVLQQVQISDITTVSNAQEARQKMDKAKFDLFIINTPLIDEFGYTLAKDIAKNGDGEVILLVKAEIYDEISQKTEDDGIMTMAKPLNKALLWNALKMVQVTYKRIKNMQVENQKLIQKIEDVRIIDRAKCILISHLSMTENEAHRYIEKRAMDMRASRREIANEILKTYEN